MLLILVCIGGRRETRTPDISVRLMLIYRPIRLYPLSYPAIERVSGAPSEIAIDRNQLILNPRPNRIPATYFSSSARRYFATSTHLPLRFFAGIMSFTIGIAYSLIRR